MACNCFSNRPLIAGKSFKEKINECKCSCLARFKAEENGRSFHIEKGTPINIIDKVKVDAYLLDSNDLKKCDYLFIVKDKPKNNAEEGVPIRYKSIER